MAPPAAGSRRAPRVRGPRPATGPAGAPAGPLPGRERAAVLLALLAAWLLLFAPQLLQGRVFVLGDAPGYRPYAEFSRARWVEHRERTFWNPYVFAGVPAAASMADPRPQWLPGRLLDAADALPPLALPLAAHLVGMLAAAGLARALWRARAAGAAFAGLAWGMTPNLVVPLGFGHASQLVTASLMPAVLLAVHGVIAAPDCRRARPRAAALALVVAVAAMGHPQFVLFTGLLASAFALERAARYERFERLAPVVFGAAFGLAMAAAVWWPAALYGGVSVRAGRGLPLGEVTSFSFAPRDFLALAWPWAVGFGDATYWGGMRATDYPNYLGIVALVALAAAWTGRRDEDRGAVALLAWAGAAGLVMALGTRLGAVYEALYRVLPMISGLRVAVAGLIVTQLSVALLAARGLERLLEGAGAPGPQRGTGRPRWLPLVAGGALLLAAVLAAASGPLAGALRDGALAARTQMAADVAERAGESGARDLVLRLGLVALALGALLLRGPARRWRGAALAALLAVDLATVDLPLLSRASGPPARLAPPAPTELARRAAADPLGRGMPLADGFYSNDWISWRARSVSGLHGAVPRYWDDARREGLLQREGMLRALALHWFGGRDLRPQDTTRVERVWADTTGDAVWRVRQPLPRAYAVPEVLALLDDFNVMRALYADGFRPERLAVTTEQRPAGLYPGSAQASIAWERDDPDAMDLEVRAPMAAFVVVADTWCPGWTLALDGAPAPLHRVDHLLRGFAVPAGAHHAALRYVPPGWRLAVPLARWAWGLWLLLALAALIAWGIGGRRGGEVPAPGVAPPA